MNGTWEKIVGVAMLPAFWLASIEIRLRNKVSIRECDTRYNHLINQNTRIESHLWDIMRERGIKPSMELPDNIKNNNNRKEI